jgi:alpha,alpha-trehalase
MSGVHTDSSARHAAASAAAPPDTLSPADRYQELFIDVQREGVFEDCKTFVDCAPLSDPADILRAYRRERSAAGFGLRDFVQRHFETQPHVGERHSARPAQPLAAHIEGLWDELTRHPAQHPERGSLLRLAHPYVVPGGRFVEMYYWDSYFTMLGLTEPGREHLLHAMTDNFAYLIDTYGHVPNGTRTYYLSRSQPPVFALMAELCETCHGQGAARYLPQLQREHAYWMDGAGTLAPGSAHRRVVALPDGQVLNRYWDDRDTPREESWREDVATAALSDRPAAEVYRDLRAAAESGWDFSSRWLSEESHQGEDRTQALASICTTRIIPVDLNALLHKLETKIAQLGRETGDLALAGRFDAWAGRRRQAMDRYLWSAAAGAFLDWDWTRQAARGSLNAATVVPLFTGTASAQQADAVAATVQAHLLCPGGLSTTQLDTGEQWDRPNGWAPLQWMAATGLAAYGHRELAATVRERWLKTVREVYARDGKLVEKYALRPTHRASADGGGGGEYPLQDGFGWTNGVVWRWLPESEVLALEALVESTP